MILHTQPGDPWTDEDFDLLEAYQILEQEKCVQCGLPRYVCHSSDDRIHFDVHEDTCNAKFEVERHEANLMEDENYERPKGTVMVPRPWMTDRSDFVTLRRPYYEAEAERHHEIDESHPTF